ncbi:MAG: hypothetical protein WCF95_06110 [bacterium]
MEEKQYKRWYDYDPKLSEVIELLRYYQDDLRSQAEIFLEKIESIVGKSTLDKFYEMVKPIQGKRWYDKDPVISKTIELLRIVPPETQKIAAENFIKALEDLRLDRNIIKENN